MVVPHMSALPSLDWIEKGLARYVHGHDYHFGKLAGLQ